MHISRRGFATGALSAAFAGQFAAPAFAQASPALRGALDAIRVYGEAHRRHFTLPGMTLGVTAPNGFETVLNFGVADLQGPRAIRSDTLFQIGSISKSMTATLIHQFAAQGRLKLTDRLSALLPEIPLPAGNPIQLQHVLDHIAGLPSDAPTFPAGGLWTAYAPGAHWHYSNTGYEILGKVAEHVGRKPLGQLIEERVLVPLGMKRSRGAIVAADRALYAQGYEAANNTVPYAHGMALAPAPWVDVTFGAGSVASTADDMNRFLRSLANAAQGRGGLGLSPQQGTEFTHHFVPSDTPGMSYGNGLMQVTNGPRTYLHHTGGMLSFTSAFHVDIASGVGAFASSTLSAFSDYRPRLLTRFAVDALTDALAGRPIPAPPPLEAPLANAATYVGRYAGPGGVITIASGDPLTLVANGESAALQPWGGEVFHTTHSQFRDYVLMFERRQGRVTGVNWGPQTFVRDGEAAAVARSDPALARLAGRYVNDNPWYGTFHIVERGGRLWLGTDTPLVPMAGNLWRVGEDSWTPERAAFADYIDGRPQTLIVSGEKYLRHDL
jgi:CubicO group peptidase (beta-lactamase class C family)